MNPISRAGGVNHAAAAMSRTLFSARFSQYPFVSGSQLVSLLVHGDTVARRSNALGGGLTDALDNDGGHWRRGWLRTRRDAL